MRKLLSKYNPNFTIEQWVWFSIFFTLPLSIRLNSLSIIIGSAILVIRAITNRNKISFCQKKLVYLMLPVIVFFVHLIGVYDRITEVVIWKEMEQMLPLIVIPVMSLIDSSKLESVKEASISALVFSLTIAGIIMLGDSFMWFITDNSISAFTYHNLALPFNSGAIYMSFFIVTAILQMDSLKWLRCHKTVLYFISGFFVILILFLASKLMIIIGGLLIILKYRNGITTLLKRRKLTIPVAIILSLILVIPLGIRLKEIANPDLDIVYLDKYSYDSPLNGLNLRLIQLRMGLEILDENNAWVLGIGVDRSQELLNDKYTSYGIYTGYEGTEDTGYLGYNFHNQFMETFVRSGVIGVLLLIAMFVMMFATPTEYRIVSNWIIILIFMFFLTESVLERQQGIVYFCLLYSSYFPNKTNEV